MNNQNENRELTGKTALVTGGTKGIGKAIADQLSANGAKVIVVARTKGEDLNSEHEFIAVDVTNAENVKQASATILEKFGAVDILINNAGANLAPGGGHAVLADQDWEEVLQLNLFSAIRFDRALTPGMIANNAGVIIHISSGVGVLPLWDTTMPYAAAKAALNNYSKSLSNELASKGIRVLTVSPGLVKTGAVEAFLENLAQQSGSSVEEITKSLLAQIGGIPLDRMAQASEVADLVAFLVSPRASYLTGQNYFIDGGIKPVV